MKNNSSTCFMLTLANRIINLAIEIYFCEQRDCHPD